MIRRCNLLLCIVLLSSVCTGCWSMKNTEALDYVNAIGIDLVDGQYVIYTQMLNLNNMAKQEQGSGGGQPLPASVGVGRGASYEEAIENLYESEQKRLFWDHVNALVLSRRIIHSDSIYVLLEELSRSQEIRYNLNVYGTDEQLLKLFQMEPLFYKSRYLTKLHNPIYSYRQNAIFKPVELNDFLADYYDPGRSAIMPSLVISHNQWFEGKKKKNASSFDGIYVFERRRFKGFLPVDRSQGVRWMNLPASAFIHTAVGKQGMLATSLIFEKSKSTIDVLRQGDKVKFAIRIEAGATINHKKQPDASKQSIREQAVKLIEEDVKKAFLSGVSIGADLLQLGEKLYRHDVGLWKQVAGSNGKWLTADMLDKIEVDVRLESAGKYK